MNALARPTEPLELVTPALRLRPWQADDVDALCEAVGESLDTAGRWLPRLQAGYRREDAANRIALCREGWAQGAMYAFGVFDAAGRLVGDICLNRLDGDRRSANLGYWVRQSEQRKGIALAATRAVAEFAFATLGLVRIEIVVAVDNQPSRRTAERAGAYFDGISPDRIVDRDQAKPAAVYSLLPPDPGGPIPAPDLHDGTWRLRAYRPDEAEALHAALHESMDTIGRWQGWCSPSYALDDARQWIARTRLAWRGVGDECALAIVDNADQLVGSIGLNHWQSDYRMANLGYWVRQSRQGQGAAAAAVRLLARHALQVPELQRLEIVAAADNLPSRRVAEKAGARLESIARNRLSLRGEAQDAAIYALVTGDLD
ncbi:GNAT family N-acetyltransferase [Dyella sp. C9]|uniref:GNAT family N-acetyltransferase n=1 Tax=Dyella sp. C9 TaxID=2202154 RepID=UPI000DEEDEF4|nr:GNAT family N-acetyltransferase [Dyella sp. C9]